MTRAACTFREADVRRAIRAVTAAGLEVARVEIEPGGKIIVVAGKPSAESKTEEKNPWDRMFEPGFKLE